MRYGAAVAPASSLEGGRVLDPAAVGQALRQLLLNTKITTTRALIAASDAVASYRVFPVSPNATDSEIAAEVKSRFDLATERMAHRYVEVTAGPDERMVFSTVWDRHQVTAIATAVRQAGLDPAAVDLKSLCLARALAVESCILIDMTVEPCEVVLIAQRVPHIWHTVALDMGGDFIQGIADALRPVVGFYKRSGGGEFVPNSPLVVRSDPALPAEAVDRLEQLSGRSVLPVPQPGRVDAGIPYVPYLTCLGLIMRRDA